MTAVGLAVTGLALAAPDALTTSVSLGLPFVPFGDATARLLTPIGVLGLLLVALALVLWVRPALPVLRRSDLLGAVLVATALGAVILTFAAADPAR